MAIKPINYKQYAKNAESKAASAANAFYQTYKPPGEQFERAPKLTGGGNRNSPNRLVCCLDEVVLFQTKKGSKAVAGTARVLAIEKDGYLAAAEETITSHPTFNADWIVHGRPNAVGSAVRIFYGELDNRQRTKDLIDPFMAMGLTKEMTSAGDFSVMDPWLIFTRPGHGKTFEMLTSLESDPDILRSLAVQYAQFRGDFLDQDGSPEEIAQMIEDAWVETGAADVAKMFSTRPQFRKNPLTPERILAEMSHTAIMPAFRVEEIGGKRTVDAKYFKRLWSSTVFVVESFIEVTIPQSGVFAGQEKMNQRINFKVLTNDALAEYVEAGHDWAEKALADRDDYLPEFGLAYK